MNPAWLALGVALSLLASAVRTRGWFAAVRAGCPSAQDLRYRDVLAAYFSGAGLNGVLPARAGDAVKLAALRRRLPAEPYSTLAATLAPPGLVETAISATLLVGALGGGLLSLDAIRQGGDMIEDRLLLLLAALPAVALLAWLCARRVPRVVARLRRGMAIMGSPRRLLTGVVAWQLVARAIRLAAVAALIVAFSLPLSLAAAVIVMLVQGTTPSLGGAVTPLRAIVLAYSFPLAAGQHIGVGHMAAFLVGSHLALAVANLAVGLPLLALGLRSLRPRTALRALQQALAAVRPALRRIPA